LIDHTNGRVLDVLESREKSVVLAWLAANKAGLLADLREVTIDMWDAYAQATREVFGEACEDRLAGSRKEFLPSLLRPRQIPSACSGTRRLRPQPASAQSFSVTRRPFALVLKLNAAMRQGRYSPELWKECTGESGGTVNGLCRVGVAAGGEGNNSSSTTALKRMAFEPKEHDRLNLLVLTCRISLWS
jgi:hypothetical protein